MDDQDFIPMVLNQTVSLLGTPDRSASYRVKEQVHEHRFATTDGSPQVDSLRYLGRLALAEDILKHPSADGAAAAARWRRRV